MIKNSPLIFVVYDGINNSIFDGQVLQPLIKHKTKYPDQPIIIISFEKKVPTKDFLKQRIPTHIASCICFKKYSFLGMWSLLPAIFQLKKFLSTMQSYTLIARGPLAGLVSLRALKENQCSTFTIQVRGLLTEEYVYVHGMQSGFLKKMWHTWRKNTFAHVEELLYRQSAKDTMPIIFETVSTALKEHLINFYHTPSEMITLAVQDVPRIIAQEKIQEWRAATRTELEIPDDAPVYCYNGSIKPWQCPEKTIQFFKKELEKNPDSFLLLLTQDILAFEHLLQQAAIPATNYAIMTVPHVDIYRYLAACDVGIIFRENHIINWTSRPTKILEYQAVGLSIAHNNTIALLAEKAHE